MMVFGKKKNIEKPKIKQAISSVQKKQINFIKKWEDDNPNWQDSEQGRQNYCSMVQQVTAQLNEEHENKIIKGIAKEVVIN